MSRRAKGGRTEVLLTPEQATKGYRWCRIGVIYSAVATWLLVGFGVEFGRLHLTWVLVAAAAVPSLTGPWLLRYLKRDIQRRTIQPDRPDVSL